MTDLRDCPCAFTVRQIDCPHCFEGRYEIASGPGYVSCECETCDGTGELDAACAECLVIRPINDDGLCSQCVDANTLPLAEYQAKYFPDQLTETISDPFKRSRAA